MAQSGPSLLAGVCRRITAARGPTLLLFLVLVPGAAAQGAAVQGVDVRLTIDGPAPVAAVRTRLQETVETVAQRLLVGRRVDQLLPAQSQLQGTLSTVVDRVIAGYSVSDARIDVGVTTAVAVRLRPDPPLIQAVEVLPRTEVDPAVAPLLLQPVEQTVAPTVRAMFLSFPVEALEWAGPLIADDVRRAVEGAVPGFSAGVRVRPGVAARVEIDLLVRDGRVVRDIGVRFRSSSIPLLLLEQHGPAVLSMAGPIRGLPVIFVERQRDVLARLLSERLRAYRPAIEYHIVAQVGLSVAETTYVTVVADSLLYRGRVEATLNVGTDAPAPELRAHLGRLLGSFELFAEVGLAPNTLSTRYDLGVRYQLSESLDLGASYTLNTGATTGFAVYRLSPDLSLRAAYEVPVQQFEGSLRYRINEFFSGEVVGTSDGEYWVRLISNL